MIAGNRSFLFVDRSMQDSPRLLVSAPLAALLVIVCLCSLGCERNPEGAYDGEVRDWVKLLFKGELKKSGGAISLELVLTQTSETSAGGEAVLLRKSGVNTTPFNGAWSVEQGRYRILFKEQVFFLTKHGDYHHFQTEDSSFANEDGTPVQLQLDKVRSVSFGLKVTLLLKPDEVAIRKAGEKSQKGTWETFGETLVAEFENDGARETEKMYFTWDEKDLLLRKIAIARKAKVKEDFDIPSQKSRISRMEYQGDERPRYRRR